MIYYIIIFLTFTLILNAASDFPVLHGHTAKDEELRSIVSKSLEEGHPLVKKLWEYNRSYNYANHLELAYILQLIAEKPPEIDYDTSKIMILDKLKAENDDILKFTSSLRVLKARLEVDWPLVYHKMAGECSEGMPIPYAAIPQAIALIESHYDKLWEGKLPIGYEIDADNDIVTMDDKDYIYGSVKGIALKMAILRICMFMNGFNSIVELNELMSKRFPRWLETSSFVHLTPIPIEMELGSLSDSPYLYRDPFTSYPFLTVIHNGFAYGGHRNELMYARGKHLGPEDSTSGIGKLIVPSHIMPPSTKQFLNIFKSRLDKEMEEEEREWLDTEQARTMLSKLDSVNVRTPEIDIKPGQIYSHPPFVGEKDRKAMNRGGHTSLILGLRSDNKTLVTLGWGRGYPEYRHDGFAIQDYSYNPSAKPMVFSVKT